MRPLAVIVLAVAASPAPAAETATPGPVSATVTPAHAAGRAVLPVQALAIVRQLMLRLDDAMRSGNYTVVRDLAAPSLRETQTAADLAAMLGPLRAKKVELLGAGVLEPQLSEAVIVNDGAQMRLSGRFATQPLQIGFKLVMHAVAGEWRVAEMTVGLAAPPDPAAKRVAAPRPLPARDLRETLH